MAESYKKAQMERPQGPGFGYSQIRNRIQDGDVLLFQGRSALSHFIRWGSKSPYSHAGVALWWRERLLVVQSATRGVEILSASTAVEQYDGQVDWWQPLDEIRALLDPAKLMNAAFDELGKPFAVLPLVALVARMFRGREWGNPDGNGAATDYFCSQLVSRVYRHAGVDLVQNKADHDTSPGDLARSGALRYCGVLHHHPHGISVLNPAASSSPSSKAANAA
jgi:hypothetical protein